MSGLACHEGSIRLLPLPLREGAGGRAGLVRVFDSPLPPSPSRKGRGSTATSPCLTRAAIVTLLLLSLVATAFAVEPSERLADHGLEARAVAIGATLRCLVCQNESIEDSGAGLAHDIRVLLRQLLLKGDTDEQARQAIVARYGDFVLLQPPVKPATYILWFGPVVMVVLSFAAILLWLRRRPATMPGVAPLSPQEQRRLDTLLREADR